MRKTIATFAIGLVVGAATVGFLGYQWKERQLASFAFLHELGRMNTAVSMLTLASANDLEKMQLLAEQRLSSSIEGAYSLISYRPIWSVAYPSLTRSVNEAEDYAVANGLAPRLLAQIRDVEEYLKHFKRSEDERTS